jgi:hypothetical protein
MTALSWPFALAPLRPRAQRVGARHVVSTATMFAASAICRGRAASANSICKSGVSGAPFLNAHAVSSLSACQQSLCRESAVLPVSPRHSGASLSVLGVRPVPV